MSLVKEDLKVFTMPNGQFSSVSRDVCKLNLIKDIRQRGFTFVDRNLATDWLLYV